MQKFTPFLMFEGQAAAAMRLYTGLFAGAEVVSVDYYGENEYGTPGSIKLAIFSLNGQQFMCTDSAIKHAFTFTPALSIYVMCESEAEIEHVFEQLSDGGKMMMPLGPYPFSKKFGWVADRFGVSWQLTL